MDEKFIRAALDELLQKKDILAEFQKMFKGRDPVIAAILELTDAMDKIPKALELAKQVDQALFKAQMELAVKMDSMQAQLHVLGEAVLELKRAEDD